MAKYETVYKCLLCGEKFSSGHTTTEDCVKRAVFIVARKDSHILKKWVHECEDGSYGVGEFIGYRKVE